MNNQKTITKIWKGKNKKVPLPLMKNDHLQNCYRRCIEIIYGDSYVLIEDNGHRVHDYAVSTLTKEEALDWVGIFKNEASARKINLPVVNKDTYHLELGERIKRRIFKHRSNKNFDKKFQQ